MSVLADLHLDEARGRVRGYEVSDGCVCDTLSGQRFLPASPDMKLGGDMALVPFLGASDEVPANALKPATNPRRPHAQPDAQRT